MKNTDASSPFENSKPKKYKTVCVNLSNGRNYPIYIGTNFSELEAGMLIRSHINGHQALIITNDKIAPLYLDTYTRLLTYGDLQVDTFIIPDGESFKSMEIINSILQKCLVLSLDRYATLVALGGGVIGDTVGFAAAIYQRGIPFIQIPTTVMATVDSSVGGKTSVNHSMGKNMIGAFHQPNCVFIDTDHLQSLPPREFYSGLAEVIKYGLIRDSNFFTWLGDHMEDIINRDEYSLQYLIQRSCQNKAEVVQEDEKESKCGLRAMLNLGHTFGHAIETASGYGTYLHGEAVSIGIVMAATISFNMNWISKQLLENIINTLKRANCPVTLKLHHIPMNENLFWNAMKVDKKVINGNIRLILLKGDIGNSVFTDEFDEDVMKETVKSFLTKTSYDPSIIVQ